MTSCVQSSVIDYKHVKYHKRRGSNTPSTHTEAGKQTQREKESRVTGLWLTVMITWDHSCLAAAHRCAAVGVIDLRLCLIDSSNDCKRLFLRPFMANSGSGDQSVIEIYKIRTIHKCSFANLAKTMCMHIHTHSFILHRALCIWPLVCR